MFIHWEKGYEIGNLLIDTEHRLLIMLFRKLDIAIKTHESDVSLMRVLLEVKKFSEFHFLSEENLMHDTGYPDVTRHGKIHSDLLAQLDVLVGRFRRGREMPDDLLYFLNQWILQHIAHEDARIARHVEDAEQRPVAEEIYPHFIEPFEGDTAS